ncbi:MAG TPA: hypothetical protein DCS93_43490 [Microscillaceae bacterium]|nr:hypothetical protein [Microscillaceae bacterium]
MKKIKLNLLISETTHLSGTTIVSPLHFIDIVRLNITEFGMAKQLYKAIHKNLLTKGSYHPLLKYVLDQGLLHTVVEVPLEASKKQLFPKLTLKFDCFYLENQHHQFLGFIPTLGVQSAANSLEELIEYLKDNIQLEFIRKKRFESPTSILTTQWFSDTKIHAVPTEFDFYTLAEQEDIQQQEQESILPQIAQRLQVDDVELFRLEKEFDLLLTTMKAKHRSSVLIVGGSGKGKTALVKEFCRIKGEHGLGKHSIWEVSAAQLLHRLTGLGSWEEYLADVCRELRKTGDILYVSNFAELFEVGQYIGNNMSMADYLRDYISRGEITVISECTPEEASRIEMRSPGYLGLLTTITIEELSNEQILEVITEKTNQIAAKKDCAVEEDAIQEILRLQQWYTPYSELPGKTIHFLASIVSDKEKKEIKIIDKAAIFERFCQETGMPEFMINPEIPLDIAKMKAYFQRNIYGQQESIDTVTNLMVAIKAAVVRRGKPLASLLFVGPTGVGKTEMAKVLAQFMFGNRSKMIRFDMSEYTDIQAIMRLTGDGLGGEGLLTSSVRQEPFSVLLFDELEKVHPSFYDLLLQILGEGRLTDARGRVADFCSTIIIMTSNIGARSFQTGSIGFVETKNEIDAAAEHFKSEVQAYFRPELFNRLDRVIAFAPLDKVVVRKIIDREIDLIKKREGIKGRNLEVEIRSEVLDYLGKKGYNANYGARFLQRTLQKQLIIPFSQVLNEYDFNLPLQIDIYLMDEVALAAKRKEVKNKKADLHESAIEDTRKKIIFEIQRREDIEITQRIISENEKLKFIDFITLATRFRRETNTIDKGSYYARFLSKIDRLERKLQKAKRRKKESDFWKDEQQRKHYYELTNLKQKFEDSFEEIGHIESDNFLVLNGYEEQNETVLHAQFKTWAQNFFRLKAQLVALENPEFGICSLGIYGAKASLFTLAELYIDLAKAFNLSVEAYTLWYNHEGYLDGEVGVLPDAVEVVEEEEDAFADDEALEDTPVKKPKSKNIYRWEPYQKRKRPSPELLIGVEMQIKGALPYLYFRNEGGVHHYTAKSGAQQKYLVLAMPQTLENYRRPENVFRKNTYQDQKPRRVYEPKLLKDKKFDIKAEDSDYLKVLKGVLADQFNKNVDEYLLD